MSSEWKDLTLGDVTTWSSGGTPKKDVKEYWNGDIPWISANSMYGTRFSESELKITEAGLKNGSRLAEKDSILLLVRGGALHSRIPVGIATRDVAFNQDVKSLRAKEEFISPWFLLFWLMAHETFLLNTVVEYTGIGAGKLDTKRMQSLPFKVPPRDEMIAIEQIAKALDDRIALLRETNTTLEAIAQALFKSWFVDFDPVYANAGSKEATLPPEIQALFPSRFVESEQGLIPEGWEWVYLDELVNVTKGKSYSSKDLVHSNGTALVTLKSFERGGGFRMDGFKPYVGKYKEEQIVLPGDLIVAYTDVTQAAELIGKPAIVVGVEEYDTLVASLDVGIVRPKDSRVSKSFLYGLFCTDDFQIHTYAHTSGSTVLHLAKNAIGSYQALLPCQAIIDEFTKSVCVLEQFKQLNIDKLRLLTNLRDTLLPRLISGQLRLLEAENELEDVI